LGNLAQSPGSPILHLTTAITGLGHYANASPGWLSRVGITGKDNPTTTNTPDGKFVVSEPLHEPNSSSFYLSPTFIIIKRR
jgi:hypothetical protein